MEDQQCSTCSKVLKSGEGISLEANRFCNLSCKDEFKAPKKPTDPANSPGVLVVLLIIIAGFGSLFYWAFTGAPGYSPGNRSSSLGSSSRSSSSRSTDSENWYEGGSLHRSTANEWLSASEKNRLATASDFAASAKNDFGFNDMEGMKAAAFGIKTCIDKAAEGDASQKVSVLAATCIILMK